MNHTQQRDIGDAKAAELKDAGTLLAAGSAIGDLKLVHDGLGVAILPPGYTAEQFDLDVGLEFPRRKKGERSLSTAESFIRYVNAHKTEATAIYANKKATQFVAVLNDHQPEPRDVKVSQKPQMTAMDTQRAEPPPAGPEGDTDQPNTNLGDISMAVFAVEFNGGHGFPGWGDFTAVYSCPVTKEWERWNRHSQHNVDDPDAKRGMKHAVFIQFIEDNLPDIVKPEASALLAAVRSFEAKKDVQFKSAVRLDNGDVAFRYEESTNGVTNENRLALPSMFTIAIPVFEGGDRYELDANLRYRISNGGLHLWYELVRPHKVLEHAFNVVNTEIAAGVGETPIYAV